MDAARDAAVDTAQELAEALSGIIRRIVREEIEARPAPPSPPAIDPSLRYTLAESMRFLRCCEHKLRGLYAPKDGSTPKLAVVEWGHRKYIYGHSLLEYLEEERGEKAVVEELSGTHEEWAEGKIRDQQERHASRGRDRTSRKPLPSRSRKVGSLTVLDGSSYTKQAK